MANLANESMLGSAGSEARQAREANGGELISMISEIEALAKINKFGDPRGALKLLIPIYQTMLHSPQTLYFIRFANIKCGRNPNDLTIPG